MAGSAGAPINRDARVEALWMAALFVAVFALYLPSTGFGYINVDDNFYVYENPFVKNGLTAENVARVFASGIKGYYIPVTWLSLMADVSVHGLGAGGFHATNALLHAINALLLYLFLKKATGLSLESLACAGLWAAHPLRVEAVAWVTARKDLLCGLFLLLCLLCYQNWAQKKDLRWYLAALGLFVLGLLSKPILVTVPLLLLAADFWPLRRFGEAKGGVKKLIAEKIPFAALAAFFSWLTVKTQSAALVPDASLSSRLSDIATSYLHYLYKTLAPFGLTMQNRAGAPHLTGTEALAAWALIAAFTIWLITLRKKAPFALAGWLWYLAALFPVSGVVPVGVNFTADRFTYLPAIGVFVGIVWGGAVVISKTGLAAKGYAAILAALLAALSAVSLVQLSHWKNGVTLFSHAVDVSPKDPFAHRMLAFAHYRNGSLDKAYSHYAKALMISPQSPSGENTLDTVLVLSAKSIGWPSRLRAFDLLGSGNGARALELARDAMRENALDPSANFIAAQALLIMGDTTGAESHFRVSLSVDPSFPPALLSYGRMLAESGRREEAMNIFGHAARLNPEDEEARRWLERLNGN